MSAVDERRSRRMSFDGDASGYDARPPYPVEVFEILQSRCGLGPGSEVLEIGPGTGQATLPMLDAGATVHAIELGANLAARLRQKAAGRALQVEVGAFEEIPVTTGAYDLVVSATAFHWVPTAIGLAKAARALRPGGWLALWWTVFQDPGHASPFAQAIRPELERIAPSVLIGSSAGNIPGGRRPHGLDTTARIADIEFSGAFADVEHATIRWSVDFNPEQLRGLYATFSPWRALDERTRERALDVVTATALAQGTVSLTFVTATYLASRRH